MRINEDAIVRVRREIVVPAAAEEVWALLANVGGWPRWLPIVGFSAISEAPEPGTVFQWKINGIHTVSRMEIVEPGRRIGWSNSGFGTHGGHLWTLSEVAGEAGPVQTRVESIEVLNGWVTWLMRRTIRRTLEHSADLWMESLGGRLSSST